MRKNLNLSSIAVVFFVSLQFMPFAQAMDADSCECPKVSCLEECEIQTDITFYSEKCAGGTRVKSCAKPTCVKVDNAPAKCGFANQNTVQETDKPQKDLVPVRDVASVTEPGPVVGRVKFAEGVVQRILSSVKKSKLNAGDEIHEKDRIETDSTGKAQVIFDNGNIINITPNSEVIITQASTGEVKAENKRMVLDLLKGRVRNQVKDKYDGVQSYYRVRTGAAVAGVRGTDFVVSMVDDQKEIAAKIETVEGEVELSDQSFKEKVSISKGETASLIADRTEVVSLLAAREVNSDIKVKGRFTPVEKLSDDQLAQIQKDTDYTLLAANDGQKRSKQASSMKDAICSKPAAALNQCAWSCENNPTGEKRCRTDLPNVTCVRRICNANGEWSQPTRLPSSYREACSGGEPVVKSCDY